MKNMKAIFFIKIENERKNMTVIIGLKINNKKENALKVQQILTENGCKIKTRIGLNIVEKDECSASGLILLEIVDKNEAEKIKDEIGKIKEIEIQEMNF